MKEEFIKMPPVQRNTLDFEMLFLSHLFLYNNLKKLFEMWVLGETSGPRPWPGTARKDVTLGGSPERLVRTAEASGVARGVVSPSARGQRLPSAPLSPPTVRPDRGRHSSSAPAHTRRQAPCGHCVERKKGSGGPFRGSRAGTLPVPGRSHVQV